MAGLRNIRHEVSHDEIRSEMTAGIDECIEKFNDGFASEAANWRAQLPTYRILCVCEAVDNLLLWSHYADQHKGVVFQLECLKELDVPLLLAKPVISLSAGSINCHRRGMDRCLSRIAGDKNGERILSRTVPHKVDFVAD